MTDSMVERVARALYEADDENGPGANWRMAGSYEARNCVAMARAAIAAMREPTVAMVSEADGFGWWEDKNATIVWHTMIDAALEEPNGQAQAD